MEQSQAAQSSAGAFPVPQDVLGRRCAAAAIDLVLLLGLFIVLGLTIGERSAEGGSVSLYLTGPGTILYFVLVFLYYFALEAALGQTLGKLVLGLRVVRTDGSRPSILAIAVRTLLRAVDFLPFMYVVGLIILLATAPRRRRLGDIAARTRVVRT